LGSGDRDGGRPSLPVARRVVGASREPRCVAGVSKKRKHTRVPSVNPFPPRTSAARGPVLFVRFPVLWITEPSRVMSTARHDAFSGRPPALARRDPPSRPFPQVSGPIHPQGRDSVASRETRVYASPRVAFPLSWTGRHAQIDVFGDPWLAGIYLFPRFTRFSRKPAPDSSRTGSLDLFRTLFHPLPTACFHRPFRPLVFFFCSLGKCRRLDNLATSRLYYLAFYLA